MEFDIALAGLKIHIDSYFSDVFSMCGKYLIPYTSDYDILVDVQKPDIMNEIAISERENGQKSSAKSVEKLAVYRKIAEELPNYDAFLMHGAAIAVDNAAYLFIAKSGTGKTTHITKWLENLDHAYVVNGDKPLIRILNGVVYVCGTPWSGKESLDTNIMVPLRAIVIQERSPENHIRKISFLEALSMLVQQVYRPADDEKMRKTLSLFKLLNPQVSFYRFDFNNFNADAFDVAHNALCGKEKS